MRNFKSTLLIALLTMLVASGCAQLPRDGEIKVGPNIESGLETDYLYYSPAGPVDGASQEEILKGFISAGTGPQNGYAIAREYLSKELSAKWDPNMRVVVQDGQPQITFSASNSASIIVPILGDVNELGQYQSAIAGSTEFLYFEFIKENDQWRISKAPDVTMVVRPVFDVIFKAYSVYFYDHQSKYLVPDVRWFPSRASTSTRLVNALLNGPSEWLAASVKSAIPNGTTLNLNTVTVAEGVASVDLSRRALTASGDEAKLMQAQISQTLLQLPSVYSVRLSIERGVQNNFSLPNPSVDWLNAPVALSNDNLFTLDGSNFKQLPGAKQLLANKNATDFALSPDGKNLVMLTVSGVYYGSLSKDAAAPKLLAEGHNFASPAIDAQGYIWLVPKTGSNIMVFDTRGNRIAFDSRWLSGAKIWDFSISSEGARAAVITGSKTVTHLNVMGIVRDESGVPQYFDRPISPNTSSGIYGVSWLDQTKLGLLEKQLSEYSRPVVNIVGGGNSALPAISSAMRIVGSNQSTAIYVVDSFDVLFQYRGTAWQRINDNVLAIHYSGN